MLINISLH